MKQSEIIELTELLKKLEAGFLPYPIFEQIARLTTLSIIEFVPLRTNSEGKTEVLLLERGMDDPLWPGEVHTPGTVVRPTDRENDTYLPFHRITKEELQGVKLSNPYYVGSIFNKSKRGAEQAQIYWVEVLEEPKAGAFYSVESLPDNLVTSQEKFIKLAAKSYSEQRKK
jgi:hypothetical protein